MKLTDQVAGHEIAGHEFAGHKNARYEIAGRENAAALVYKSIAEILHTK